ncbi:MAG TPA: transglutaminase domain-containing protein, partial [Mucilaginibacter sp.]|nr:transglutaminase domain-containing protein [Mucilaginibacter sp.]
MRKFILLFATCFITTLAFAQDFTYGEVDNQALDMKSYNKDTSAHAVVLNEHGMAKIIETNSEDVNLQFEYHARIKFFDDKEFERYGTVEIPIYTSDGLTYDKLSYVKAITYYKDDNGNIQKAELDPKKVYSVVEDKHHTLLKFAMPALRKGCVIEVMYEIESPYYWNHFHTWMFQDFIPKINSQFEAFIPGFWFYNASLRGYLKLSDNKAEVEKDCFSYHGAKADCSHLTYDIRDVPAFIREEYMTSPNNYLSGIYFQLVEFTNLNTGAKEKYSKDWKDIDYELKSAFWFGGQLKRKDLLKDRLGSTITGKTDSLEKAKAVYTFIQKSFKWNEMSDFGSADGIKKALDAHAGNAGDINLALVTALNSANIPAQAVLLSTRENGTINKLYPTINDFDYVIARTTIGGKTYMLDATNPLLAFGTLPLRCLNDQGRVFSLDKPSYWIDMVTPQREINTYNFNLTLQDDGKLKGTLVRYSSGYSGYLKRVE